jgi:radical SAM superfamily enzyme YgiQ (UPF0313 family)
MKIFIGNPPWKKGNRLGVRAGSRWPFTMEVPGGTRIPPYVPFPFFLAYAAAVLERGRFPVMLVDAIAEGLTEDEYLAKVVAFDPDLVLHETSTASIAADLRIAREVKESTRARVALAGPHVSVLGGQILRENAFADFILIGEYELTLLDLCRRLTGGAPLEGVEGLCYRGAAGVVRTTPRRPPIEDLNTLPWPARHFLPMETYRDVFCDMPHPMLQMWASRGCPYRCIFCLWPDVMYGGHKYRTRDPGDVADEIERCQKEHGFKSFYFDDDTFNLGKPRIVALCREIKKRDLSIPWAAMCRADTVDEEMLREMKDSGLIAVKYGIESASQEIVNASGKHLDLDKADKAIELTRKLGIRFHLTFTFGLPGETHETVKQTLRYAIDKNPDCLQFSLATPFPGTEYYRTLKESGGIAAGSWDEYDGSGKSVIRTERLSREELEGWLHEAYRMWDEHLREKRALGKVTVYIPCYNAAKTLDECLKAVTAQSHPIDEILVIDDGSTDETVAIASRYPVKIVRRPRNLGLAASRNTAFRAARNEFVAAVDADVALDANWLENIMQNVSDPAIAGACGRLVEKYRSKLPDAWRSVHMPQHWGKDKIRNPYFLFGADSLYRKSRIVETGLYGEGFKTNFEDVDVGIRLAREGKPTVYDPSAVAYHLKRDTITSVLRAYYLWYSPNYPPPLSAAALAHRLRVYFGDWLRMFKNDFRAGRESFLIVDIMLWLYRSLIDATRYVRALILRK